MGHYDCKFCGTYGCFGDCPEGQEFYRKDEEKKEGIKTIDEKEWVQITEPSDIKKCPIGTEVRINKPLSTAIYDKIYHHYEAGDYGFDVYKSSLDRDNNLPSRTFQRHFWNLDYTVFVSAYDFNKYVSGPDGDFSVREGSKPPKESKIKSDGGSSDYYLVTLPEGAYTLNEETGEVSFMLEEYIKYGLGNDFNQGNLAKANHRIGKKEGNTLEYDKNKMHHYVDRL